jgi:hypothetical protein
MNNRFISLSYVCSWALTKSNPVATVFFLSKWSFLLWHIVKSISRCWAPTNNTHISLYGFGCLPTKMSIFCVIFSSVRLNSSYNLHLNFSQFYKCMSNVSTLSKFLTQRPHYKISEWREKKRGREMNCLPEVWNIAKVSRSH